MGGAILYTLYFPFHCLDGSFLNRLNNPNKSTINEEYFLLFFFYMGLSLHETPLTLRICVFFLNQTLTLTDDVPAALKSSWNRFLSFCSTCMTHFVICWALLPSQRSRRYRGLIICPGRLEEFPPRQTYQPVRRSAEAESQASVGFFFHCISQNNVAMSLPWNQDDSFVSFLFVFFFPSTNLSNGFCLLTVSSQHRQEDVKLPSPRRRCESSLPVSTFGLCFWFCFLSTIDGRFPSQFFFLTNRLLSAVTSRYF